MDIAGLRAKYPGYADDEIIGALKATKYPGYSEQEIGDAIGYKPKSAGFFRGIGDLGVEAASGVARGVKFTADAFGAGNAVSRGADTVDKFARDYLSASAKADDKRIGEIMAAAQDAGVWDQVKAAAEAFAVAPGRMAMNALGTSVPTIAAAMIPGVGQAGAAARLGMLGATGALQGAGTVKGSIYEAVKAEQMKQPGMTEAEADAIATQAQEYGGKNTANIVGGMALGGASTATGLQPVIAGMLRGGGQAVQAGQRGMLQSALNPEGLIARTGMGALKEAPLEAAQGGQEQYAGNVALQREGFDVPAFRGVAGSATLEGLASGGLGAAVGAMNKPGKPASKPDAADVLAAPTVDASIDFAMDVIAKPVGKAEEALDRAKALDLVPLTEPQASVPFESDESFGGMLPGGKGAPPAFKSKRDADIYIGAQALFQSHEAVEASPDRWEVRPTAATDALMRRDTRIPTGEATEFEQAPVGEATELPGYGTTKGVGQTMAEQRGVPAGEAAEIIPTGDAAPVENIPVGDASEAIPTPDAYEVAPVGEASEYIPAGEATELPKRIPVGQATELDVEVIEPTDIVASDGRPFGARTSAQAKAYASGGGKVVAIPDHFGSGKPGFVVRPITEGRPNNTRGTNAADVIRAGGTQAADTGRSDRAAGVPDNRPADVLDGTASAAGQGLARPGAAGDGAQQVALNPGQKVTLPGKDGPETWTVVSQEGTMLKLDNGNGRMRAVKVGSPTWAAIQPEGGAAPAQTIIASGGSETAAGQPAAATLPRASESDQDKSRREWRENFDRVVNAPDLSAVSTRNIERAIDYATSRSDNEKRAGWDGSPINDGVIEGLDREIENLKFALKQRNQTQTNAKPATAAERSDAPAAAAQAEPAAAAPGIAPLEAAGLNKVGDLVKLTKPGAKGRVNIAGTIKRILPDGRLEVKTQQDGYFTVAPSELGHKPGAASPAAPQTPEAAPKPKVYKTRAAATLAGKQGGNTTRVKKINGGFILRDASEKELAAADKAGRRLAAPKMVDQGRDPLLTAIAKIGGLAMTERADTIGNGNKLTKGGHVFRQGGQGIDTMAEALKELHYIPSREYERDGGVRWLRDAIRAEHNGAREHFSEAGDAWMEDLQAEAESRYNQDAMQDFDLDDLDASGYTQISPEAQALTEQLLAEAGALGLDTEALRDDAVRATEGKTDDEYHAELQAIAREAVGKAQQDADGRDAAAAGRSAQDDGKAAGDQGQEGAREGLSDTREFDLAGASWRITLTRHSDGDITWRAEKKTANSAAGAQWDTWDRVAGDKVPASVAKRASEFRDSAVDAAAPNLLTTQTPAELKAKTEREAAAEKAERDKKAAEQARLRKDAEALDLKARADQSVGDFQLGQSADQQMSGMGDLFAEPAEPAITPAEASNMQRGDIVRDGDGVEYYAWSARFGRIDVMPLKDGKPVVNNASAIRFALDDTTRAANPEYRTDPLYLVRSAPAAEPLQSAPTPDAYKAALYGGAEALGMRPGADPGTRFIKIGKPGIGKTEHTVSIRFIRDGDRLGAMVSTSFAHIDPVSGREAMAAPAQADPFYKPVVEVIAEAKARIDRINAAAQEAQPAPDGETAGATEAAAPEDEAPQVSEAKARQQFEWRNLGQKDGTKTHALFWYVKPEDKGTGASMRRGDVQFFQGADGWKVNGEGNSYRSLAAAKFTAEQEALVALREQGWIAPEPAPATTVAAILDAAAEPPKGAERLGVLKDVKSGAITPDEVAAAYPAKGGAKIDDFGEKLEGARKDFAAKMRDAMAVDVRTATMAEAWPEPNYAKLIEGGADQFAVGWVRASRDEIPTRPQVPWKLGRWVESVTLLRKISQDLLSGTISAESLKAKLTGEFATLRDSVGGRAELYEALGHEQSLKGIEVSSGSYSMLNGVTYNPAKTLWTVERKAKGGVFGNWPHQLSMADTRQGAISRFIDKVKGGEKLTTDAKGTKFDIWRENGKYHVGKKIGRDYASLKKFDDVAAARQYKAENQAELEAALARYKDTPFERRTENLPRVGEDHRGGAKVTPEVFADAFSFRGIQFGNYVEQSKRQADLNDAYDALMDLAAVIGVPPRALSLGGQLGLAFGARGKGGTNAAAAHYEPGTVVINLTKESGAGSLAHELLHAMDNYFAKLDGGKGGMMTLGASNPAVRPEMVAAFKRVTAAAQQPGMKARSRELDKRRSKAYWSTSDEMAARSFEAYVIAKLRDQGAANDYLANIVSPEVWDASEALLGHGDEKTYPYPTQEEMGAIREAFDGFFDAVQTRTDDAGNVAMYSKSRPAGVRPALDAAIAARAEFDAMDRGSNVVEDADAYYALSEKATEARSKLADKLAAQADDGFALQGRSSRGRLITLNGSAQNPGQWQLTRFDGDGEPLGDSQYTTKKSALADFLREIDLASLQDMDGAFSRTIGARAGPAITEPQARAAVATTFGDKTARALLDAGLIEFVTGRDFNGATYADGRIQINLDAVTQDSIGGVLQHEAFHAAVRDWLGAGNYAALMNRMGTLRKLAAKPGALKTWFDAANAAIPADTRPEHLNEEVAAYAIQAEASKPQPGMVGKWVQDFLSALRTAIIRRMPDGKIKAWALLNVKPQDLARMAVQAMQARGAAVRGEAQGAMAYSRSAQTETPAFKRWFSGSQVVDADGAPLVVYHGTASDVAVFNDDGDGGNFQNGNVPQDGIWFTDEADRATWYAGMAARGVGGNNVMPVYLALKNPYTYSAQSYADEGIAGLPDIYSIKKMGHDGVIVERGDYDDDFNIKPVTSKYYVAFRPEQIKSATGNSGAFDPANADIRYSRTTSASAAGTKTTAQDLVNSSGGVFDFNKIGETKQDRIRTIMDASRPGWLGLLTRDQIADVYGAEISPVKEYDQLTRKMENQRSKIAQDADDLYNEWAKLPAETNDKLARLMLDATVHSVHPDVAFAALGKSNDAERQQVHARLKMQYALIGKEAQAIYGKVRDFHQGTLTQLRDALEDRVKRQVENGQAKAAALTKIRQAFDAYLKEGPYFPLSRFGDFIVVGTREADGERVVASYATSGEQAAAARTLEADGFTVKTKTAKTYSRETDGSAGKFIGDVLTTLSNLDMTDATVGGNVADLKTKLMDDVNQLFIKALPDLSYRKHFMHRKGTPGFSSDMMRGFASSAFHAASHIARLNHGDKMTFALQDAFTAIEQAPSGDFNLHSQVLNELTKRHDAALNPNTHPVAAMLNQVGFVMYLGLSPAAGLINMMQTVMVTMPHLGARYGFGKANVSLAAALADITTGAKANSKNGWNAAQSTKLTAAERAMMSELQDEGVIDLTQAHDLSAATGLDSGNVARSRAAFAMARAMKIVGWTFHIPEVMNRQVAALSAYRLEMEKSGNEDAAKDAARETIKRTHFDYSSSNRARFMQGNVARVLLQFKQYSQNMTYLLGRAAHQALKGESPEVRSIARRQLVATFGVTFGMAGALGLPGLGSIAGLIGLLVGAMDDDDEPWDWKVEFRNLMADTFGKEVGEVISHGAPRALMPWDIANRVSLGDLWFRDSGRQGQSPREAFATDAANILGPTAGTVLGLYTAADHMARGNWSKAAESVVPKFLRDPIKAIREGREGVTSYSGEPLMDVTGAEVMGRLLGFAPARASEMYEGKAAVMNAKTAIEEKRQSLISRMAKARIDRDAETIDDLQPDINAFNQRNPAFKINGATIAKAVMTRRRNRQNTEAGILLPRTKDSLRDIGRFAEVD